MSGTPAAAPGNGGGDEDADLLAGLEGSDVDEDDAGPSQHLGKAAGAAPVEKGSATAAAVSRGGEHGAAGSAAVAPGGAEALMALVGQYDENEIALDEED